VIDFGPGLPALTWVAALITLTGLATALWSVRLDRRLPAPALRTA
jgi:MFS transporter, DHA1 family, inner membrane transport protein